MLVKVIILCSQLAFVALQLDHQQPVAKTLWQERCAKNSYALNDCNWCRCGANMQYLCKARVCSQVDVFGHFNDAIREIDVGMEGHGVWRSKETACDAGLHYRRGSLLCVCNENGVWPNPLCRDIFRVLHPVEIPDKTIQNYCSPTKLYLIGCNVCFCPSTGRLDPELCTKRRCENDDPVLQTEGNKEPEDAENTDIQELYAECEENHKYKLGCRSCTCLRNNRLVCDNCTAPTESVKRNYCDSMAPLKVFNVECNLCYCDATGHMICSVKRCLGNADKSLTRRFLDIDDAHLHLVDTPIDDVYCQIGTKYKKGCNTCICLQNEKGVRMFACTVRNCVVNESPVALVTTDCVLHSTYERDCLKCMCVFANEQRWEWCETDSRCSTKILEGKRDLANLKGYCEPSHHYTTDCNYCQCHSNGKALLCTDLVCDKSLEPVKIDLIPVKQHGVCQKGHSYKIDCNVCVCLTNGNTLCTTMDCNKQKSG